MSGGKQALHNADHAMGEVCQALQVAIQAVQRAHEACGAAYQMIHSETPEMLARQADGVMMRVREAFASAIRLKGDISEYANRIQ